MPWTWIPSLYFVQGLPYVVAMTVSPIMLKDLGYSNTEVALYTSLLYLPWVVKPLWSPLVEVSFPKRTWTIWMQGLLGLLCMLVGMVLQLPDVLLVTILGLWGMALASATHDIAADGFYMLGLDENQQAFFVGFRSLFYRIAMMAGVGLVVVIAGLLAVGQGKAMGWGLTFGGLGLLLLGFSWYHSRVMPRPIQDQRTTKIIWKEVLAAIVSFFRKDKIGVVLLFLLLFRFGEAQLVKLAGPFMLDPKEVGGLGLSTVMVGNINLWFGVPALIGGGILGGMLAARDGMKRWFWPMVMAINLPNLAYVWLAFRQPDNWLEIGAMVGLEKFGYGFGFTGFMLYLLYVAQGSFQTTHYALGTGLMALGMMIPGMWSGWLQEEIGYLAFFIWVMVATIPSFAVSWLVPLDKDFGKKERAGTGD